MHRLRLFAVISLMVLPAFLAHAESGVSDERVALPDGPGSLGSLGMDASASDPMGAWTYSVPIEVPEGFPLATPELALRYSSLGGNAEVGMGWSLPISHIERFPVRGLPRYTQDDVFAADGSHELVHVGGSSRARVYRARFEGAFLRYTWHADESFAAGYWEAEYPDGSRAFFGATAAGTVVAAARLASPSGGGVFRYMLVERQDRFGHSIRYDYVLDGQVPLVSQVRYLQTEGGDRYRVQFTYQQRCDHVSGALPGFVWRLTQRLHTVQVFSGPTPIRKVELEYDDAASDDGACGRRLSVSRLGAVRIFGLNGEVYPAVFRFGYAGEVSQATKARARLVDMGALAPGVGGGVDLKNGLATLIDINGDALPDALDTSPLGQHRFFLNTMNPDGSQTFAAPHASSQTRGGSSFVLGSPGVQVVDLNGDGFADLMDAPRGQVLCGQGQGDWSSQSGPCGSVALAAPLADNPIESGESDPLGMRFLDYDGDRRIDLLHTVSADLTQVWRNTPDGFEPVLVEPVGKVFDESSALQLADLNGDGLLDPVEVGPSGQVWYRLNLGLGRWGKAEAQKLDGVDSPLDGAELQDLNGDGLDDVVLARGNTVQFALNQAGTFLPLETVTGADVVGGLPTVTDRTSVLYADMNASGSTDVVWIEGGRVRFFDLFEARPHLLTRIDNGLGGVITVEYGSSALQQARDLHAGRVWPTHLPFAMSVVTAIERRATLQPARRLRIERAYHDGFYDGVEKRYRGFASIEERTADDGTQQAARRVFEYDVGATDPYREGKLIRESVYGGDGEKLQRIQRKRYTYADCPVAELPREGLRLAVRHLCQTDVETVLEEGRPAEEWVTLREQREYDGYGQVIGERKLGVVGMGEAGTQACAPCDAPPGSSDGACGPTCAGDELHTETAYVAPRPYGKGRWMLGLPQRQITYGPNPAEQTGTLYYYDGPAFVGLPEGQATLGLLTRQCERRTPDAAPQCRGAGWVATTRARYDSHGNPVELLDPLGAANSAGHRRLVEYEPTGLRASAVEILVSRGEKAYRLRREVTYDPSFGQPASMTRWMLRGAEPSSARGETRVAYDAFGRRSRLALPGDTLARPTQTFTYLLSAQVSRVVVAGRSVPGGELDLAQVRCIDGLGHEVQTRTQVSSHVFQVSGFRDLGAQGRVARLFGPYQGGEACDLAPPENVPHSRHVYDALGRPLRVTAPDKSLYGTPSEATTRYRPLLTTYFDAEDNDPTSQAFDTPTHRKVDGLGRLVRLERQLGRAPAERGVVRALWDGLGRLAGYVDGEGHIKRQTYDLLGRVVRASDPDRGVVRFEYDAASNLVATTDARGKTTRTEYDGANRPIARFDPSEPSKTRVETEYDFSPGCDACRHGEGRAVSHTFPLPPGYGVGRDEFEFDLRGQRVRHVRSFGRLRLETSQAYDLAGRLVRSTYPDGTVFDRQYDRASRVVSIGGVVAGTRFDTRGLVRGWTYASGLSVEQTYDPLQRLHASRTLDPQQRTLFGFEVARDRLGNVVSVDDPVDRKEGGPSGAASFVYDPWYRVRGATLGLEGEQVAIGFDAADNITDITSSLGGRSAQHVGSFDMEAYRPHAVAQAGDVRYTYDAAGHVIRRGALHLTWDHQGRLVRAETEGGGGAEYAHDQAGARAVEIHDGSVTYYAGPDFEVRDGIAVVYARHQGQRVARFASAALGPRVLSDGNGDARIDAGDAWLARRRPATVRGLLYGSARRLLLDAGDARVFLHGDSLGSLTMASSAQGSVLGKQTFYPLGTVRFQGQHVDRYGFTGQRLDPTTGFIHFARRELDPVAGRWMSPDPLFEIATAAGLEQEGQSTTAYAYAAGRFASWVDPTGLLGKRAAGLAFASLALAAHAKGAQGLAFVGTGSNARSRPGVALVTLHDPVHFAVTVVEGDDSFTTHQMPAGNSSWVHTERTLPLPPHVASGKVWVPNIIAARAHQENLVGRDMGPYDGRGTSCVAHVCDVLRAGGVETPEPGGPGQLLYLVNTVHGGVSPHLASKVQRMFEHRYGGELAGAETVLHP